MKGWSFNGLVKALKSAAFKDVGVNVGQVPLVGDSGLLSIPVSISSTDFNNIDYKSGATFTVNPPYKNWPFGDILDKTSPWLMCVDVGQGLQGGCVVRVFRLGEEHPICVARRIGSSSWSASPIRFNRQLTAKDNPNSLTGAGAYGDWYQQRNVDAVVSLGYPTGLAGILSVGKGPYGAMQEYTSYMPVRKYVRAYNVNGAWDPWTELITQDYDSTVSSRGVEVKKDGYIKLTRGDGTKALSIEQNSKGVSLSGQYDAYVDLRGFIKVKPRSNTWYGVYDEPDYASAVSYGNIVVPGNGYYYPLISCRIENGTGTRNATGVSFGTVNNSSTKHSAVISLTSRDGGDVYRNYYFTWAGDIDTPKGAVAFRNEIITTCRFAGKQAINVWRGPGYKTTIPYVLTGLINNNQDDHVDTVERCALQYYTAEKGWVNFAG